MSKYKILELYSGIGGMHYAFEDTKIDGEIVAAIDINTVANKTYKYNFPNTNLLNRNIQSLSIKMINQLEPNVLLMSPPCQPFTRNGLQYDSQDPRSDSFTHIINILKDLHCITYILMENVKGFETSDMRNNFVEALNQCGFCYKEFLLHPHQIGIPNARLRYYCVARRKPFNIPNDNSELLHQIPNEKEQVCYEIKDVIENDIDEEKYILNKKQLRKAMLLDICYSDSRRSCCFTKAYSHFLEGTGSVYTKCSKEEVDQIFKNVQNLDVESDEYYNIIQRIRLRFFTAKEISLLMSFPIDFNFPPDVTNKQRYRLLGNSINVKVISKLIYFLIHCD